jgi:hypothetical protein
MLFFVGKTSACGHSAGTEFPTIFFMLARGFAASGAIISFRARGFAFLL